MTDTTPNYAELLERLEESPNHAFILAAYERRELLAALRTLLEHNAALKRYAREATIAITGLTPGGSEYFGKRIGDMYTADLPYCVERIRERMGYRMDQLRAEARLAEALKALAEVRRRARNIWGACSSDQIIDKDVEGQAKLMLEYIDAARTGLEKGNSDGE